jgi:hypothetical protein
LRKVIGLVNVDVELELLKSFFEIQIGIKRLNDITTWNNRFETKASPFSGFR